MARQKKRINNTPYPQYTLEAVARCVFPDIVAFFQSEEGQREFEDWIKQKNSEIPKHNWSTEAKERTQR